jgi:hypothetical protein
VSSKALKQGTEQMGSRVATLGYLGEAGERHGAIGKRPPKSLPGSMPLPKRNYGYEKRQKELKKQLRQEEKRQRRLARTDTPPEDAKVDETTSLGLPQDE